MTYMQELKMTFTLFNSILERFVSRWPLLLYAATWTAILTMTVAVASFSPEAAFVSAITPTSAFSRRCQAAAEEGFVRLPMDVPTEFLCFPAHMFRRSKMDLVVPPVFAAVIVACSAYVVRALGLWDVDDESR